MMPKHAGLQKIDRMWRRGAGLKVALQLSWAQIWGALLLGCGPILVGNSGQVSKNFYDQESGFPHMPTGTVQL